jgi:hypothetical protein
MVMSWSNAFKDAKGDWNLAECVGAPAAVLGVITALYHGLWLHEPFDLQAYGLGIGGLIAALGAAQRLRGDPDIDRDRIRDADHH